MANQFANKFQQGLSIGQGLMDAYEKAQMRKELKAANALQQEQQTLGVNAPEAGAVPAGYEGYLTRDTQTGAFRPVANAETNPEDYAQQGVMAERFNAPGAFAGQKTSYSLGDVTRETPFSPEDITTAKMERKADIYSNYGHEDLAEQMRTNALARKSAALQIKKLQSEVDDAAEFKKDMGLATTMMRSAADVAGQAKQLMDSGDREGAARLIADWRSKNVPDDKMIRVNENGLLEGSKDGGKTWVQAAGAVGNVYNPKVVEGMLSEVTNSADEHLNRIMFKHAKSPEALSQMLTATKELAIREKTLDENKRQFGITTGLTERKIGIEERQGDEKIRLMDKELAQKGLLIPSEIQKNLGIGAHYRTANALQDYQLANIKGFDAEKTAIIKDLDAGKIDKKTAQERLNMAGLKFGGKLTESKEITSTALKDIEEIAGNRYPDWAKMPEAKKAEVRAGIKAEMGYGSGAAPVDYMSVVSADKGAAPNAPAPSKGLTPVQGGTLEKRQQAKALLDFAKGESDITGLVRSNEGVKAIQDAATLMQGDPYFDIMYRNTGLQPLGR
jgi:hypothetical protein